MECLDPLEKFLHDIPERTPLLLKAAMAHAQFETIHPFLDGNGRLGRLLITLLLCAEGALREPILYLSVYLRQNRDDYFDHLQRIRSHGDWEGWLRFFFEGVLQTAGNAVDTARLTLETFARDRERIQALGRSAGSALRVHRALQEHPILTIKAASERTGLAEPTVNSSFDRLERLGIVAEVTGRKRDRLYSYAPYIALLVD